MRRFFEQVVKRRSVIILLFAVAAIAGAITRPMVAVNYDMNDYLPPDSPSTIALDVMEEEFSNGIPGARIMLKDVSIAEALQYKEAIASVDGVTDVQWLDDAVLDITMPLSFVDQKTLSNYYIVADTHAKTGDALLSVTIDEDKRLAAVSEIREIIGETNCMSGNTVSSAIATMNTVVEIKKITALGVSMTLLILILTTLSWLEPLIVLVCIGSAIVINGGSNLIFGEISFVTNAAGSILQLAVSLDYCVFLIHRFEICREETDSAEEAMIQALCRSFSSITSSGLTTIIGFLALVIMRFQIGPDMGLVLAKGVVISLITVFTLTPALVLVTNRLIEKTRHRRFLPDFRRFGSLVRKIMIPAVCVFVVAIIPAFVMSNSNAFYYGSSHLYGTDTQVGVDREEINQVFGQKDTYALMVPKGDARKEADLIADLSELKQTSQIRSYGETLGYVVPEDIVPSAIGDQLLSEKYSRIAISLDLDYDGAETFQTVRTIRGLTEKYYGKDYYLAGEGVSTFDLMETTTADMLKVNIVAIVAVLLVLMFMFRSFLLPVLLVASIETAIWINVAIPDLLGDPVFYIAYLIISAVQLGSTVDYAILMTDRYREIRLSTERRDAVVETIRSVTASIITSGGAMVAVGFIMDAVLTHKLLAQLGAFIGRGALCSMIVVFLVLPGLLYIFDRFVVKKEVRTAS